MHLHKQIMVIVETCGPFNFVDVRSSLQWEELASIRELVFEKRQARKQIELKATALKTSELHGLSVVNFEYCVGSLQYISNSPYMLLITWDRLLTDW